MNPDKNFRMNKSTKRMLALMGGAKDARDHFKAIMIKAQLAEEAAHRQSLKSSKDKNNN